VVLSEDSGIVRDDPPPQFYSDFLALIRSAADFAQNVHMRWCVRVCGQAGASVCTPACTFCWLSQ
jgi:hypothetical protein